MRHATRLLFASALALAATRAGAQVPDNTPSLADELLRMWNKDYSVEGGAALDDASWEDSGFELDDSGASPADSRSMTPNLDRLLGNGMDAAPNSSAPVAKDSPYGFAPNHGVSKGGSAGNTIDTNRRNNQHRPEPPRCGQPGHRHTRQCRPQHHSPRCGEPGHRHDHRCRPHNPPPRCDPPDTPPTPTPEPASMLLLGIGAGTAAGVRAIRKRRKK